MPARRPRKVRTSTTSIADRLHAQRLIGRFSQDEIAREVGCNRAAFSNYELGRVRLPLNVGLAFCRRLDINPRFLATGKEPRAPFLEPSELGIDASEIRDACERGLTFEAGYKLLFEAPTEAWFEKHGLEEIVMRQLEGGPAKAARKMSLEELKSSTLEIAAQIVASEDHKARAYAEILQAYATELRTRFEIR